MSIPCEEVLLHYRREYFFDDLMKLSSYSYRIRKKIEEDNANNHYEMAVRFYINLEPLLPEDEDVKGVSFFRKVRLSFKNRRIRCGVCGKSKHRFHRCRNKLSKFYFRCVSVGNKT